MITLTFWQFAILIAVAAGGFPLMKWLLADRLSFDLGDGEMPEESSDDPAHDADDWAAQMMPPEKLELLIARAHWSDPFEPVPPKPKTFH